MSVNTFSEYGGADSDHRSAFFYGHLKIVGHAHRELTELLAKQTFFSKIVSKLPKLREIGTSFLRVIKKWW